MTALQFTVAGDDPVLVPVRLDLATLRGRGEVPALLRTLLAGPAAAQPPARGEGVTARLAQLSAAEGHQMLVDLVCAQAAVVLGHVSGSDINADQSFTDLGFDSLSAVEFRNRLAALVGIPLPATLVFDFPTPEEIAVMLLAAIAPAPVSGPESILADLDRLEGLLAGLEDADETLRAKVSGRLDVLRTRWGSGRANGSAAPAAEVDLGSASDEEVFNLLDQQLGLS